MEYTKLGNTDITISRVCVGCMSFFTGNRLSVLAESLFCNSICDIVPKIVTVPAYPGHKRRR